MRWLVVAILLAGCANKSPSKCRAEAEELERFLKAADHKSPPFEIRAPMTLVVNDHIPTRDFPYADEILVFGDHWKFIDDRHHSIDTLAQRLAQEHERGRKMDPDHIYLVIDRAATWDRIVAAFEAAHDAGFTKQLFVFVGSKRQPAPPPSPIDAELDATYALEGEGRVERIARPFRRFAEQCPTMKKGFRHDETRDRTTALIEDTTKDLIGCNCNVDIPSLRAAMWRLIAAPVPLKIVEIEAVRPGTASPRVVIAPVPTRWSDVGKRLIDANGSKVWLVAEP
jgi:hypothetical protein